MFKKFKRRFSLWKTRQLRQLLEYNDHYLDQLSDSREVLKLIELLKPRSSAVELVRIGGDGDGGYLVPDDLADIDACFSPGVSTVATFDEMLAELHHIPCYLADYSVNAPPTNNPLFDFEKKFVGSVSNDKYIRLEDWITSKEKKNNWNDLILQMDIEGGEYDVLIDTPAAILKKFRIIVLEVHDLDFAFSRSVLPFYISIFTKLTKYHQVVHLHPNNNSECKIIDDVSIPKVLELTLIRKDRFILNNKKINLPHPLDMQNTSDKPGISLANVWW
jgi:Methyltransferase FkbM domain